MFIFVMGVVPTAYHTAFPSIVRINWLKPLHTCYLAGRKATLGAGFIVLATNIYILTKICFHVYFGCFILTTSEVFRHCF